MDIKQAETRIRELREILWENSRLYYVENAPLMSDYEFDQKMHELEALEKQFPSLITSDSPTRKVGSDLSSAYDRGDGTSRSESGFRKAQHRYPMLSLANTYSLEEVQEFVARAEKTIPEGFSYSCELKFDGTGISLTYRNGHLVQALTRGDGSVGDDVTENIKHIGNIPLDLKGSGWPDEFEIRGEILMPWEAFLALNREREDIGEAPFANPRNAASGSLKLIDPREVGKRGLMCTLYHIPTEYIDFASSHSGALDKASGWGLPVSSDRKICHGIGEVENYLHKWETARKGLPYATDGVVIKIDELSAQLELGYTAKFPRWAVAYKFKSEEALTQVLSIDYQVGRTGAVTPVANLSPVPLSGTTVKRATLNNEDQMRLLDLHDGDWVWVEKGGEIIPKITRVEVSRRTPGAAVPEFPKVCPDCGTPLFRPEGEARWFCPNTDGCPMQAKGRLIHFAGRKAMNILAGEATVEQLYNLSLVKTPADFYDLTRSQLMTLDGWKERSAERFLESLEASKSAGFERVLFALGIRYVGEETAKSLARHFGDVDSLAAATVEQLMDAEDIGEVIARSIVDFFADGEHLDQVRRLREHGLRFSVGEARFNSDGALKDMTIVISGTYSISRDAMKAFIESNGGKCSSSISSKTSFLLAGSKPGPEKLRKAASLGVKVISEDDLYEMVPRPDTAVQTPEPEDGELTLF
ncbi:MAG: NAD-dependent DNA ligase LigA [Bacteroidales bacterium]|nr:NAD-dependent DNA ligase LigA [Bacteroidales bacterium]